MTEDLADRVAEELIRLTTELADELPDGLTIAMFLLVRGETSTHVRIVANASPDDFQQGIRAWLTAYDAGQIVPKTGVHLDS